MYPPLSRDLHRPDRAQQEATIADRRLLHQQEPHTTEAAQQEQAAQPLRHTTATRLPAVLHIAEAAHPQVVQATHQDLQAEVQAATAEEAAAMAEVAEAVAEATAEEDRHAVAVAEEPEDKTTLTEHTS